MYEPEPLITVDPYVLAVINAWNDPGTTPDSFHEARKSHLLVDWPVLGNALKELTENK